MTKKSLCFCLSAIAISCLLLASCSTEDTEVPVYAPTISVSAATVTASVEGGSYSFTYTVSNAAEDGAVQVSAGASWITNVTDSGSTVSFTVSENTTGETRTGIVSLTYSSSYGTVSKTVTVAQNASANPVLTVQPTAVAADIEGGTYSFTYSITNPASDGELVCSPEVDWISNVSVGTNSVSFTVDENEGTTIREGVIDVAYVYGNGELDDSVTVVQDHKGGSGNNGGGGGGGDVSSIIGTYTATAFVNGQGYSSETASWTLKIYAYTGTGGYDVYVEGILPFTANTYSSYEYKCCVYGSYSDGKITIPSQCSTVMQLTSSSGSYYMGFTPCVDYSDGSFYYSGYYPDLTFTGDESTGAWESDYGIFLAGCTKAGDITSMYTYFQVAAPTITLTKTSDTTSVSSAGVTHSIMENLSVYNNFKVE